MFEAVAIGTSAGGFRALTRLLGALPGSFPLPIAIVQHMEAHSESYLAEHLNGISSLRVKEAEDKDALEPGVAYIAPPNYHLLVEPDRSLSLSVDERVNHCRPAIEPLFESAADVFGAGLIGILLTGANADGAKGIKRIKACGGFAIVQDPSTAEVPYMPQAGLAAAKVDRVVSLEEIPEVLLQLTQSNNHG